MPIDAETLKALIDRELDQISDARVTTDIRGLLVEPRTVLCDWDYGKPGEQHLCWEVLSAGVSIVYCESGFGPRCPWGLVALKQNASMGMDSGWFTSFTDAYFECHAADLPIWRVFKTGPSGIREPITDEGSWDATWKLVMELRESDPASRYDCDHSIVYDRQS